MKKTIIVAHIREDLTQHMPDEELMSKYGLSEDALRSLLDKLLRAMSNGSRYIEIETGK